jgi:hypothetical protein
VTAVKRVAIVGASGMVGGYALRYLLENPAVGGVTSIGRRNLGVSHPKLTEILHPDFADCSPLADALTGHDAAVHCLGTYTDVVSDAELRAITVDYTIAFARVLRASSPNATFAFLSGSGADPTGRSRMPFVRYKGEAENALSAAGFSRVYVFRPAYIYPVQPRREPNVPPARYHAHAARFRRRDSSAARPWFVRQSGLFRRRSHTRCPYAVVDSGSGSSCWIDVTCTMTPARCASIDGSSARSRRTAGIRFKSSSFAHASSSSAANPPAGAIDPPRTFTRMSIPPRRSRRPCATVAQPAAVVMSAAM